MLNSLTVRTKLLLLATIPLLGFLISTIVSLNIMGGLISGIGSLYADRVVPLKQIKVVSDNYAVNIVDYLHKYRSGMLSDNEVKRLISQSQQSANDTWQAYLLTTLTPEEASLADDTKRAKQTVEVLINKYVSMINQGQLKSYDSDTFNRELYGAFDPLSDDFKRLIDLQLHEAEKFKNSAEQDFSTTRTVLITVLGIAIVAIGIFAWMIYHSVEQGVSGLKNTIVGISRSADLRMRARVNGNDEIAQTATGFNQMVERLESLVRNVAQATITLSSSAEEMSSISNQVASTAVEQEQQTTMIATAITQMSSAIQEVANNAAKSSEKANQANASAELGQVKIRENISGITLLAKGVTENSAKIEQLSNQTNDITQVVLMIQGIAEQTNLLALNAAIEAARAGDTGRGFAVVADEVRKLAHNTQESTTTINDMISKLQASAKEAVQSMSDAQIKANHSVSHAEESSKVLTEIVLSVEEIADMNTQVSVATEEQTTVADELSGNVNELAISISTVAENATHSATASRDLAELASHLQAQVSVFKTH